MRFLLILLLSLLSLLSLSAYADHHRDHALVRLAQADMHFGAAGRLLDEYAAGGSFTVQQTSRIRTMRSYINAIRTEISKSQTGLIDDSLPLQDIRRLINQPLKHTVAVPQRASALNRARTVMILSTVLIPVRVYKQAEFVRFSNVLASGWNNLDEAAWHVTDAILEEQFGQL